MTSKTYTETDIANLIDAFNAESETPAPAPTRRTRIVEQVTAPVTGYRVTVAGHDIDVDAADVGSAVLAAIDTDAVPHIGGYVFLGQFIVTDSTGTTHVATDRLMRESLEAARIARADALARARREARN